MSTNPVDIIAGRHKEIRKARERITKVADTLERERARLATLTAQVGAAEIADRQALGESIVAGRPEPPSEAAALRAEIETQERRVEALVGTLAEAERAVANVAREHSSAWSREQMREVAKAQARYGRRSTSSQPPVTRSRPRPVRSAGCSPRTAGRSHR